MLRFSSNFSEAGDKTYDALFPSISDLEKYYAVTDIESSSQSQSVEVCWIVSAGFWVGYYRDQRASVRSEDRDQGLNSGEGR